MNGQADLTVALGGDEPDWDADPDAADDDTANRYLWRIGCLDDEADQVRAIAENERARVDAWETEQLARLDAQRNWLARACTGLLAARRAATRNRVKSIDLPNGRIVSTKGRPVWDYELDGDGQPGVFLAWAASYAPDLVRRPDPPPPAPDKNTVKARLVLPDGEPGDTVTPMFADPETGELVPVPGLSATYTPPTFDVDPRRP